MCDNDSRRDPASDDARARITRGMADVPGSTYFAAAETVPSLLPSVAADVLQAASEIDADLADRSLYVRQLLACRGGSNNAATNARKALSHWRLKHNELPADRRSIESALADEIEALQAPLVGLVRQLLKVEVLRLDRERAVEAEARYAAKRDRDQRTGLYEAARNVVDRLNEDFGIAEGHWYAITEEGLPALRDVVERETAKAGLGSPLQPTIRNKRRAKRSR